MSRTCRCFLFCVAVTVLLCITARPVPGGEQTGEGDTIREGMDPLPESTISETAPAGDYGDYIETETEEAAMEGHIRDPLEPFNRAMFVVNDKLYFWILKPIARGYAKIVAQGIRRSVADFFSNATFPIRVVNCLLQGNLHGAGIELGRFAVNTTLGIGGLMDVASRPEIALSRQEEDFGQTLGTYGIPQGIFILWPVFGPSTVRDSIGTVGDGFLNPVFYLDSKKAAAGITAWKKVNDVSLTPGAYESFVGMTVDPYAAMRDAYVRYRRQKVRERGAPAGGTSAAVGP